MAERIATNELKEILKWPDTMWPDFLPLLTYYPLELLPDIDELRRLRYPWELKALLIDTLQERVRRRRISHTAEIALSAEITGLVWMGKETTVLPQAVIVGPTVIGNRVIVGNHTLLRECIINDRCIIGDDSEVARSIFGQGSTTHRSAVIDSLVGNGVTFGGARAVNVRLDRKPVYSTISGQKVDTKQERLGAMIGDFTFLGSLSMTNPGVKIGTNCQVGPGVILYTDLPDNTRILLKQKYDIQTIL